MPMYGSTTSSQHAPDRQERDQANQPRLRGNQEDPRFFLAFPYAENGKRRLEMPSSGLSSSDGGDPQASAGSGGGTV